MVFSKQEPKKKEQNVLWPRHEAEKQEEAKEKKKETRHTDGRYLAHM